MSALQLHEPPPAPPHAPQPLDVRVWMPHFLFMLQTFAHSYADAPTPTLRKKYFQLLSDLPLALPDVRWQAWFQRALIELPVGAFLVDRLAIEDWVHRLRSRVHDQLGWPPISFEQHTNSFYAAFRPRAVRAEIAKTNDRMYSALVACGVALVLAIAYFSPTPPPPRRAAFAVAAPAVNALETVAELARTGAGAAVGAVAAAAAAVAAEAP